MNNRAERLIFFLVVWFTMFSCYRGWGQNPGPAIAYKDFLRLKYPGNVERSVIPFLGSKEGKQATTGEAPVFLGVISYGVSTIPQEGNSDILPANLYYLQSGYFCKREWDLEKATHIPFRFRLGSLADCNALEGKH